MEKTQPNLKRESFTSWPKAVRFVRNTTLDASVPGHGSCWDESDCSRNPQLNHKRELFTSWTKAVRLVRCTVDKRDPRH